MTDQEILDWYDYLSLRGRFVFGPPAEVENIDELLARLEQAQESHTHS